jgi:hypothetical protein
MTRVSQKRKERYHLDIFLKTISTHSDYLIKEYEKPDFILVDDSSDKIIGIELSEFFNDYKDNGSLSKREQTHLDKIYDSLNKFINERYPESDLSFTLTYRHTNDKNIDFDFELIKRKIIELEPFEELKGVINSRTKNFVQIVYEKLNRKSSLTFLSQTDYNHINEDSIISIIKNKTELQNSWDSIYREKWLLIYSGFSFSNIHTKPNRFEYNYNEFKGNWDRVYFLFSTSNEVVDLLTL